jgi:hypothetical protein
LHRRDPITSLLVASIGFGSIAFHGPMPSWGEFVHDLSIVLTLVWVLLVEVKQEQLWGWGLVGGTVASATPAVADAIQALLAVGACGVMLRASPRRDLRVTALAILTIGALVGTLSRTGGPLCQPDSIWQGHGFWHVGAAVALGLWGSVIRARS